ncbi:MAG: RAD55 family ATPase [Candidatus Hydrothermarchaeales archaeon]
MKELFPQKYTVLLHGPPGVGKFEYCLDLICYYLQKGEKVIYITTEHSPEEIKNRAMGYGCDLAQYENETLLFIDCYSWSVGARYEKGLNISSPANLSEINVTLEKAVNTLKKPVRIVFESLSPLFLYNPPNVMTKFYQGLNTRAKMDYGFILCTLQEDVHDPAIVNTLIYITDGFLEMEFLDEGGLKRRMRAHHLKGIDYKAEWIAFELTEKGFVLKT